MDRQPAPLIETLAGLGALTRSGYFNEPVAVSSIEMVSVTNPVREYSSFGKLLLTCAMNGSERDF